MSIDRWKRDRVRDACGKFEVDHLHIFVHKTSTPRRDSLLVDTVDVTLHNTFAPASRSNAVTTKPISRSKRKRRNSSKGKRKRSKPLTAFFATIFGDADLSKMSADEFVTRLFSRFETLPLAPALVKIELSCTQNVHRRISSQSVGFPAASLRCRHHHYT